MPRSGEREQWNLGQLIDALAAMQQDRVVHFDFADAMPICVKGNPSARRGIDSWRGVYEELALDYTTYEDAPDDIDKHPTVEMLLIQLRAADGATFQGYKGGEFVMDRETPLWVDRYGNANVTAVVGVTEANYHVLIETGICRRWE